MRINLLELPKDGQEFQWTRATGELNKPLKDIIGDGDYTADFSIVPQPHGFILSGSIETHLPELCSFCGTDIETPQKLRFSELLLPEIDQPRSAHYSKTNHFSDLHADGPSVWSYKGHHFEAGEYFHQALALEQDIQPHCPEGDAAACAQRAAEVKAKVPDEAIGAFAALKKLKLK